MEEFKSFDEKFISLYRNKQPEWGFNGLGYIVYKRTYSRLKENGLTEEWWETVKRCVEGAQKIGAGYTKEEAERLFDHVFNLRCNFAGRMLWQLGTSTVDKLGLPSMCNCWFTTITKPEDFCFVFEHLMLGGGVGFSIKREHIHELPKVKYDVRITNVNTKDATFIVPDSREGWVELLRKVLNSVFVSGKSFSYSTILVRGAGEKINGFGGQASGPQYLIQMIDNILSICHKRVGKKLRSIDVLDICNCIGSCVVSGNVRRSAEIAIGDPDDYLFLRAKNWSLGNAPNWRAMSNNSIYADSYEHISEEVWKNGYELDENGNAKGEPYGFINIDLSRTKGRLKDEDIKDNCEGVNPCLTKDTWVLTKNGAKQISELIHTPFEAVVNGNTYKSKGFVKTGTQEIYKLSLNNGMSIKVTDNHQIATQVAGKIVWKKAKELNSDDDILLHNHNSFNWKGFGSFEQGWLLGELVGDGYIEDSSAVLSFWGDTAKSMCEIASKTIKSSLGGRSNMIGGIACKNNINTPSERYNISSVKLRSLANELGISKNNKKITKEIEQTSSEFYSGFLRGYFDSDGSIQGSQSKGVSIRLSSINLANLEACQRMLSRLGIQSNIYKNRRDGGFRPLPDSKRGMKDYYCQELHELVISNNSISVFSERIGFSDPNKASKLISILVNYKRKLNKEKFTSKLESFNYDNIEDVYDCSVPEILAFDANGIYVHNCAEATLESKEPCDLAELYMNRISSKEEMLDCAKLLYKAQKAILTLPSVSEETMKVVKKNMRIGLGVTGVCQSLHKTDWLDFTYKGLKVFDKEWSKKRGWSESIKITVVKPSGTLSLLAGSSPGGHPGYARFLIRRVRMASNDRLVKFCRDSGYHIEYVKNFDGTENRDTVVVEFPCEFASGTVLAKEMTAINQLDLVKLLQTEWADQSVSVTVYYKPEELPEIKKWMKDNYETSVKTVSFLLHSKHGFQQAPYEEISEEQYNKILRKIKPLTQYEGDDTFMLDLNECEGGACPIR